MESTNAMANSNPSITSNPSEIFAPSLHRVNGRHCNMLPKIHHIHELHPALEDGMAVVVGEEALY